MVVFLGCTTLFSARLCSSGWRSGATPERGINTRITLFKYFKMQTTSSVADHFAWPADATHPRDRRRRHLLHDRTRCHVGTSCVEVFMGVRRIDIAGAPSTPPAALDPSAVAVKAALWGEARPAPLGMPASNAGANRKIPRKGAPGPRAALPTPLGGAFGANTATSWEDRLPQHPTPAVWAAAAPTCTRPPRLTLLTTPTAAAVSSRESIQAQPNKPSGMWSNVVSSFREVLAGAFRSSRKHRSDGYDTGKEASAIKGSGAVGF